MTSLSVHPSGTAPSSASERSSCVVRAVRSTTCGTGSLTLKLVRLPSPSSLLLAFQLFSGFSLRGWLAESGERGTGLGREDKDPTACFGGCLHDAGFRFPRRSIVGRSSRLDAAEPLQVLSIYLSE